jgi:hypothetical protein
MELRFEWYIKMNVKKPGQPAKREALKVVTANRAEWKASPAEIYPFLSNLQNLLSGLPGLQRLQIAPELKLARLLFQVPVMNQRLHLIANLQAQMQPADYSIILASCSTQRVHLFGEYPTGYATALFRIEISLKALSKPDLTQVNTTFQLGIEEWPKHLAFLNNFLLVKAAHSQASEQAQKLCVQFLRHLQQEFNLEQRR